LIQSFYSCTILSLLLHVALSQQLKSHE
jgi:hypothetical protein